MNRSLEDYFVRVASDVVRDGLGVELADATGEPVTEIFRCDKNNTIYLNTFDQEIPLQVIEALICFAKERLTPFEDGSSLPPPASIEIID